MARVHTADRLARFGVTIFAEMSRLAAEHSAVNLSQGFPDFDGPEFVKRAHHEAVEAGHNQYAPMGGVPALQQAIAGWHAASWGPWGVGAAELDPAASVTVTSGCTEAIAATMLGLINPGDEVILFEPFYDSYRACVAMAGATPRFVTLRPQSDGAFAFDEAELRAQITPRTRAILINTPHNPTGKVFTRAELETIAALCIERDLTAITDEVYERLVYDPALPHIRLASLPGMAERTVTLSSLGKTFSFTGWKIGWAVAPPALTAGVRAAHQFLTYAVSTPAQHAAAAALRDGEAYVAELRAHYQQMRDELCEALTRCGLLPFCPAGTYFVMADHSPLRRGTDVDFCRFLTTDVKVAAIPPSAFYTDPAHGRNLVRFAFCKRRETMEEAVRRLERGLAR
jgi:aspartate/methionine/tyrosine aminotransferase